MNDPLVSVLICSYNAENFVKATIRSVINQTYSNMEILVLDNNSKDKTVDVLDILAGEDGRLRIFRGNVNLGAYGGLNYLLERAAGKYIAINDHDDIWHKDKIRRQVEFLETNEFYVGCGTAMINYYERYDMYLLRRQPKLSNIAWHTSLVFRNQGKRYDTSIKVATDFHFMKHILCEEARLISNRDEPCVLRTIRADNSNLSTKWASFGNLGKVLRVRLNAIDRLALLNRLLLTQWLADQIILRVLLRNSRLSRSEVEQVFQCSSPSSSPLLLEECAKQDMKEF